MHNPAMYTVDGKVTTVISDFAVDDEQRQKARATCLRNGAGDVLELLGLDQ